MNELEQPEDTDRPGGNEPPDREQADREGLIRELRLIFEETVDSLMSDLRAGLDDVHALLEDDVRTAIPDIRESLGFLGSRIDDLEEAINGLPQELDVADPDSMEHTWLALMGARQFALFAIDERLTELPAELVEAFHWVLEKPVTLLEYAENRAQLAALRHVQDVGLAGDVAPLTDAVRTIVHAHDAS